RSSPAPPPSTRKSRHWWPRSIAPASSSPAPAWRLSVALEQNEAARFGGIANTASLAGSAHCRGRRHAPAIAQKPVQDHWVRALVFLDPESERNLRPGRGPRAEITPTARPVKPATQSLVRHLHRSQRGFSFLLDALARTGPRFAHRVRARSRHRRRRGTRIV